PVFFAFCSIPALAPLATLVTMPHAINTTTDFFIARCLPSGGLAATQRARPNARSALRATLSLLAQELLDFAHQLVRVDLVARKRLRLFAGGCVVLPLQLADVLTRRAVARHRLIALCPELLDRLGEPRHV